MILPPVCAFVHKSNSVLNILKSDSGIPTGWSASNCASPSALGVSSQRALVIISLFEYLLVLSASPL